MAQLRGTDGHLDSTSFVGFDFAGGISIVPGVDAPPESFKVDPDARFYSLHTPTTQTVTLIPAPVVWEAAMIWRKVNGLHAAAGVPQMAGRFTFDLWAFGRHYTGYREAAQTLRRAFHYGLTDSLVVWHNWQRWGYDYRLPDVYPPDPKMGTLADFVDLVQACKTNGVLFAPHDNYVDIYPDAEGFSYEDITFKPLGQPVRAYVSPLWNGSPSYRLRADRSHPFIERNLKMIRAEFAPTAYFLDVWSAHPPTDFFNSEGEYFDRRYERDAQRKELAFVRDYLGHDAPVISECGHDELIGWLDGGQAQHLSADAWRVKCADSERVPWFDSAHHDRFILDGAGYGNRYSGSLDPKLHGVYSDDYIATEVLTGHPSMVEDAFSHDVVRKYWLLHDLGRALALRRMEGFEFDRSNLHRQHVRWEGGAEVYVNRGMENWTVAGHTLPQNGFYASVPVEGGAVETAIEYRGGTTIEWSHSPSTVYENARSAAAGGFRLSKMGEDLVVIPLPERPRFTARLHWKTLPWKLGEPREAEALDENGHLLRRVALRKDGGDVVLDCDSDAFSYRLR